MLLNGSSDDEKAYAINSILNTEYFSRLDENGIFRANKYTSKRRDYLTNFQKEKTEHIYKFVPIFKNELKPVQAVPFAIKHSLLASAILDYPKSLNENAIISALREDYKRIILFANDNAAHELVINSCSLSCKREYAKLLRHILISDRNLPNNIDYENMRLIDNRTMTYSIKKRKN